MAHLVARMFRALTNLEKEGKTVYTPKSFSEVAKILKKDRYSVCHERGPSQESHWSSVVRAPVRGCTGGRGFDSRRARARK